MLAMHRPMAPRASCLHPATVFRQELPLLGALDQAAQLWRSTVHKPRQRLTLATHIEEHRVSATSLDADGISAGEHNHPTLPRCEIVFAQINKRWYSPL